MTSTSTIAKQQIADKVEQWAQMLCEALKQDYITYSINSHKRSISINGDETNYHAECIDKLMNGECDYDFVIESGRKYHKIVMVNNQRSAHAFVDKQTGEVYKAASWKAPAKGVRFDLRIINQRELVLEKCDWSGGYLYS